MSIDSPMNACCYREQCLANERRIRELEAENDDWAKTFLRMDALLTGVANALKGPPQPLSMHSWHDLPEAAAKATARIRELEAENQQDLRALRDLMLARAQTCRSLDTREHDHSAVFLEMSAGRLDAAIAGMEKVGFLYWDGVNTSTIFQTEWLDKLPRGQYVLHASTIEPDGARRESKG